MIEIRATDLLAELQVLARRGIFQTPEDEHDFVRHAPHLCAIARSMYGVRPGELDIDRVERLLNSAANQAEITSDQLDVFDHVEPAAVKCLFGLQNSTRYSSLKNRQERAGEYYDPPIPYDTIRKAPQMRRHVDTLRRGVQFFVAQYGSALKQDTFTEMVEGVPRPEYLQKLRRAQMDLRERGGFFLAYGPSGYGKSMLSSHLRYSTGPETASVVIAISTDPLSMSVDLEKFLILEGVEIPSNPDPRSILALFQRSVSRSAKVRLIVLDNVTDWQQVEALFRFRPNVPVLITSQSNLSRIRSARFTVKTEHAVEVGPLEIEQATSLLCTENESLDQDIAREIARLLSGHPLSIDQAARYLKEYGAQYAVDLIAELRLDAYGTLDDVASLLGIPNGLLVMYAKRLEEVRSSIIQHETLMCVAYYSPDTGIDRDAANQLLQEVLARRLSPFRFDGNITRLIEAGFLLARGSNLFMHDLTRAIVISLTSDDYAGHFDLTAVLGLYFFETRRAEISPWIIARHEKLMSPFRQDVVMKVNRQDRGILYISSVVYLFWDYWRIQFSQLGSTKGYLFCWRSPDLFIRVQNPARWVRVSSASAVLLLAWLFEEISHETEDGPTRSITEVPDVKVDFSDLIRGA